MRTAAIGVPYVVMGEPNADTAVLLAAQDGAALAALAVTVIGARLLDRAFDPPRPDSATLLSPGASFVTLERAGALRGCVGALEAVRPLYLDVARNAGRAMVDPRLPAVTGADWPELDVTVSVLSPLRQIAASGLAELKQALRPGVDGLVLTDGVRRATFLPVVWHKLGNSGRFIAALLAKGGWSSVEGQELTYLRYTAQEFRAGPPRVSLDKLRLIPGAVVPQEQA